MIVHVVLRMLAKVFPIRANRHLVERQPAVERFGLVSEQHDVIALEACEDGLEASLIGHDIATRRVSEAHPDVLACQDGINIVAGTGTIGYGEFNGRVARAGGWGELFSDEGSAYWVAREGLKLFSRMSDGRAARGAFYDILRRHFGLQSDLDLCAAIYGKGPAERSNLAALSTLVAEAATAGDAHATALFTLAADELAQIVHSVYDQLKIPEDETVTVSYSGGMFQQRDLLLTSLQSKLATDVRRYRVVAPRLTPAAGAARHSPRRR
jgi:N-acetylglucosamine kinase-like BadF-type ATPase